MNNISIIIPCYNEGEKLINSINKIKNFLEKHSNISNYEIITVNDGSKDSKTNNIFNSTKINNVKFISYKENKGKGYAIKKGIEKANNNIIIFMDADLSTDITAIDTVISNIKENDIVIGSRHHKDTKITTYQPKLRQLMGYICIFTVKILTHIKVKDTQCGFKAFKKDIAKQIIEKQRINGWAFDVEYLYIAKLKNFSVCEIPIIWHDDSDSTVSPIKSSIAFFKELINIRLNKKHYI